MFRGGLTSLALPITGRRLLFLITICSQILTQTVNQQLNLIFLMYLSYFRISGVISVQIAQ